MRNFREFYEEFCAYMVMWAKMVNALMDAEQWKAADALCNLQPDIYYLDTIGHALLVSPLPGPDRRHRYRL